MNYDEALSLHLLSAQMGAPYEIPCSIGSYIQCQKLLQTYKDFHCLSFHFTTGGKEATDRECLGIY